MIVILRGLIPGCTTRKAKGGFRGQKILFLICFVLKE